MNTDVLIVGGGLAGLSLADQLERSGRDYLLVEARHRLGGRILSLPAQSADDESIRYDLGPTWFWPGQPKMARLVNELNLDIFEQYSDGKLVFQDRNGAVQSDLEHSTTAGSLRISGGIEQLIDKLSERIPTRRLRVSSRLTKLLLADDWIDANVQLADQSTMIRAKKVVLALPPRLVAQAIDFAPELARESMHAMRAIPTWMAGHAKVVAIYHRPFWRDAGLSGDGISHRGPLAEIHDAGDACDVHGALFGFVGVPASIRRNDDFHLAELALDQLATMFGPSAAKPIDLLVQDWADEAFTATEEDCVQQIQGHPAYGTPPALNDLWRGSLLLGSSEMAPGFGGYLEGALEAAELIAEKI
ncbi:MAG: monoamine oxidase [Gammaproteobacteria bacterium]